MGQIWPIPWVRFNQSTRERRVLAVFLPAVPIAWQKLREGKTPMKDTPKGTPLEQFTVEGSRTKQNFETDINRVCAQYHHLLSGDDRASSLTRIAEMLRSL